MLIIFTENYHSIQLMQTAVVGQKRTVALFFCIKMKDNLYRYHGDTEVTDEWNKYLKTR
jgi:hypothetical protein